MSYDIKKIYTLVQLEVEMTRKDYVLIAEAIKVEAQWGDNATAKGIAEFLCTVLKTDNSAFDKTKFLTACGF
jgi:hypothetical protein